jgi:MFS family permease
MRIRRDSLFVSSVLFTIALASLTPAFWANVLTARDKIALANLDAGYRASAGTMSDLSIACLAIILIGLIVTWTGYIKRERWTWLVMFILVWVWAFPLLALPPFKALFEGRMVLTHSEWLYSAIYQPGLPRIWAESVLIFLLMVIALLLPVKSFFFISEIQEPSHRLSPRLIGLSVMGVLVIIIALFAWIRLGVLYEIPLTELNSAQQLPAPPPPPTPCKAQ